MIESNDRKLIGGTKVHFDVTDIMVALGELIEGMQTAKTDEEILALLEKKAQLEGYIAYFRLTLAEYDMFLREGRMLESTIESTINDAQRSISLAEKKIKS